MRAGTLAFFEECIQGAYEGKTVFCGQLLLKLRTFFPKMFKHRFLRQQESGGDVRNVPAKKVTPTEG